MRRVGIGYRNELHRWLETFPREVELLEVTAEHFFDGNFDRLKRLNNRYPYVVHGLGLSLGTLGKLDPEILQNFGAVVKELNPLWITEHIAFTRTEETDLGHLNPIAPTKENVDLVVEHAHEIQSLCGKPLALENISSAIHLSGDYSEPEFLNRICEKASCGLLLDTTNLYVNARNHRYDPRKWLDELELTNVVQVHVVGYATTESGYEDRHANAIQEDLMQFTQEVLARTPAKGVIIERDWNFPAWQSLASELERLKNGT